MSPAPLIPGRNALTLVWPRYTLPLGGNVNLMFVGRAACAPNRLRNLLRGLRQSKCPSTRSSNSRTPVEPNRTWSADHNCNHARGVASPPNHLPHS